jgi:hypothetical protein
MWLNGYQKPVMGLLYKIAAHAKLFISGNYYTVIRQHLQRKSFAAFCFIISGLFFFYSGRDASHILRFYFVPHSHDSCRPSGDCGRSWDRTRNCRVAAWYQLMDLTTELPRPTKLSYHVPHWATTSHTELPRPTLSYHVPHWATTSHNFWTVQSNVDQLLKE